MFKLYIIINIIFTIYELQLTLKFSHNFIDAFQYHLDRISRRLILQQMYRYNFISHKNTYLNIREYLLCNDIF